LFGRSANSRLAFGDREAAAQRAGLDFADLPKPRSAMRFEGMVWPPNLTLEMWMDLADEHWADLQGGYRRPYDVRPALRRLASGDDAVWEEFWQELYHQGDVGEASYAAIPEIVRAYAGHVRPDWNLFALAATVEEARHTAANPAPPAWLTADYETAWQQLEVHALAEFPTASSDELIRSILAVLALAKGKRRLARTALLTNDELEDMLSEAGHG
jgi:hypothetical protein